MDRETLEDLVSDYLDGSIGPGDLDPLIAELRVNPEARRRLLVAAALDLAVQDLVRSQVDVKPLAVRRMARRPAVLIRPGSWRAALVAAGILIVLGIGIGIVSSRPAGPSHAARNAGPKGNSPEGIPTPAPQDPVEGIPGQGRRNEPRPSTSGPEPRPRLESVVGEPREPKEAPNREPVPAPRPAPSPAPDSPRPSTKTEVLITRLETVEGEVHVVEGGRKSAAVAGQPLRPGQAVETADLKSLAVVSFPDKTRLSVGPASEVRLMKDEGGKTVSVARGAVAAEVTLQPQGRPLVFTTPQAQARVLGTTLRLWVEPGAKGTTRLDVTEGRVELKRLTDGKTVIVSSGRSAVAGPGVDLAALAPGEVLLLPQQAVILGDDWKFARDGRASTGSALEASATRAAGDFAREVASRVTFTFYAEAEKDYCIWVRGCCIARETRYRERQAHDAVVLEFSGGRLNKPCRNVGAARPNACWFEGWADLPGYFWVSGSFWADEAGRILSDDVMTVRFAQTGVQTLRLYAAESPVLIDAVWLSAAQKTRPADARRGPDLDRK